jgi:ABC-2 type transport system permease protein
MTGTRYFRYELLQNARNWRFVLFSLAWPLVVYFAVGLPNRHGTFDGVSFPLYFMVGMAVLGTMSAIIASGARIALDRTAGWTRQLRITPLRTSMYFRSKLACGYLTVLLTIAVMALAGTSLGVRLSAGEWLTVVYLLLIGLIPLAVLGILIGHLVTADTLTAVAGGLVTVLALFGGAYGFLIASSGVMLDVIKALPSYWLVQAGKVALHGGSWPVEAWIVVAAWTVVLIPLAVLAYRRDTSRA